VVKVTSRTTRHTTSIARSDKTTTDRLNLYQYLDTIIPSHLRMRSPWTISRMLLDGEELMWEMLKPYLETMQTRETSPLTRIVVETLPLGSPSFVRNPLRLPEGNRSSNLLPQR